MKGQLIWDLTLNSRCCTQSATPRIESQFQDGKPRNSPFWALDKTHLAAAESKANKKRRHLNRRMSFAALSGICQRFYVFPGTYRDYGILFSFRSGPKMCCSFGATLRNSQAIERRSGFSPGNTVVPGNS